MELPDDTVNCTDVSGEPESKKGTKKEEPARPYLKSFETLPATSLNAYSQAQYGDVDKSTMWKELSKQSAPRYSIEPRDRRAAKD